MSQFPHVKRRFEIAQLAALPSIWSNTRGAGFSIHWSIPHTEHFAPYFSFKYLLAMPPFELSCCPGTIPLCAIMAMHRAHLASLVG